MNLDETEKNADGSRKKKLTRKEKKALKRAEREAAKADKKSVSVATEAVPAAEEPPEVEAELEPAVAIPPPQYSTWEKISPPAKRKKQLATMESGYREVLALVHSMRDNQEVLMESFKKLPEAVDSVKKLADHSAQQSDLLSAMNEQIGAGSAGKFNETLSSMDKTTQLLLERAQRSEERLYSMLRRAQRRIAFMTLLVLLLFLGTGGAILFLAFPEQTRGWLEEQGWLSSTVSGTAVGAPASTEVVTETPQAQPEPESLTAPVRPEPVELPEEVLPAEVPEELPVEPETPDMTEGAEEADAEPEPEIPEMPEAPELPPIPSDGLPETDEGAEPELP